MLWNPFILERKSEERERESNAGLWVAARQAAVCGQKGVLEFARQWLLTSLDFFQKLLSYLVNVS